MKNFTRILIVAFLSATAFFGAALEPARAATFFVNTKDDTNAAAPGDAACLDSLGNCSLRAALEQSNNLAGEDFIYNALVTMTDSNGETRTFLTGKSGAYSFADVLAGKTYITSVSAKRFQFMLNTQVCAVNEDVADINFVAVVKQRL